MIYPSNQLLRFGLAVLPSLPSVSAQGSTRGAAARLYMGYASLTRYVCMYVQDMYAYMFIVLRGPTDRVLYRHVHVNSDFDKKPASNVTVQPAESGPHIGP